MARPPEIAGPDLPHPLQRFCAAWREQREARYADYRPGSRPRRSRAVMTIVNNEPVFFPIWLRYYSRFFAPEDIYVLDHETDDGSTDGDGFVRISVEHGIFDQVWMVETMQAFQHELLERYDVVLTTDVDEIVVPRPDWGTLDEYIDRLDEEFVNPLGYELIHLPDREPAFDPSLPVLEQRRHWFANAAYDKPALATVPMDWKPGFHGRVDERFNYDPDLYLIHLHRMDFDICAARHDMRRRGRWGERDLAEGWGASHRITGRRRYRRWYFGETGFEGDGIAMRIQQIPALWRGSF